MHAQWQHDLPLRPNDKIVEKFLGVSPMQNRRVYFDASPISYATIDRNALRFLLIHGTNDDIVDPETQSGAFLTALTQSGFFVRRIILPGAGHFWSSDPFESEPHSYSAMSIPRMIRFLVEFALTFLQRGRHAKMPRSQGGMVMSKLLSVTLAMTLALAAFLLLPSGHDKAGAQSGPFYINAVDIDVVPGQIDAYLAALKENGAAAVHEPGCHEFNITVSPKDPNHVFIFEVYDNAAAFEAHRATDHFKKYAASTKDMVAKRDARAFASVAMNMKSK